MRGRQLLRLAGFECRKAFLNPGMLAFFVVLLICNGWKMQDSYAQKTAQWNAYEAQYTQTYEKYSGPITAETAKDLIAVYAPLEEKRNSNTLSFDYDPNAYTFSEAMDERFYRTLFYTELKYDYLYRNEAYRIAKNALELADFYQSAGNHFEAAKNQKIATAFAGRVIPAFADTRGWEVLLEYDYSAMLVLLLCLFALSGVFVTERETDMYMLLRTTPNGSGATVAAKLMAAFGFVVAVCGIFFAQDFLTIYFASPRREALQSPVYALRALESTPLNITVGQYFLWAAVVKTLGIFACCAGLLLISSLFQNLLGAFFTGLAVLLGCVALQEFSRGNVILRWWNPAELIFPRNLIGRDIYVNLLGMPVRLYGLVLTGVTMATAVMIFGIVLRNRGCYSRGKRRVRHDSI